MSLTSHIKSKDSPFILWAKKELWPGEDDFSRMRTFCRAVNDRLVKRRTIQSPPGSDPAIVGTAYDYLFRWWMQPLKVKSLVANIGATEMERGMLLWNIVDFGNANPGARIHASIALAHFESVARSHPTAFTGWLRNAPINAKLTLKEIKRVFPASCEDLRQLMRSTRPLWRSEQKSIALVEPSLRYIPNPAFTGSKYVGGADADWIIGNTLWDCKTSKKPAPVSVNNMLQLLGYALLDWNNQHDITHIGLWFPRRQYRVSWPISKFIPNIEDKRRSLRDTLTEQYSVEQETRRKFERATGLDSLMEKLIELDNIDLFGADIWDWGDR